MGPKGFNAKTLKRGWFTQNGNFSHFIHNLLTTVGGSCFLDYITILDFQLKSSQRILLNTIHSSKTETHVGHGLKCKRTTQGNCVP